MARNDKAHLKMIRTYPCVAAPLRRAVGPYECSMIIEAHHPTGGGLALKTPDSEAFPLCTKHHADFHALRGVFKGWTKERIHEWQKNMSDRFRPIDEVF